MFFMESAMSENKRITVIVPKEIHRALKMEAVKHDTTVSNIVRELIERWLAEQENDEAREE
mgnify:CR=1 FL=1